jgi:hypothetical protein
MVNHIFVADAGCAVSGADIVEADAELFCAFAGERADAQFAAFRRLGGGRRAGYRRGNRYSLRRGRRDRHGGSCGRRGSGRGGSVCAQAEHGSSLRYIIAFFYQDSLNFAIGIHRHFSVHFIGTNNQHDLLFADFIAGLHQDIEYFPGYSVTQGRKFEFVSHISFFSGANMRQVSGKSNPESGEEFNRTTIRLRILSDIGYFPDG